MRTVPELVRRAAPRALCTFVLLALVACQSSSSDDEGGATPTDPRAELWAAPTHAYDPACAGCVLLGEHRPMHSALTIEVLYDERLDDAVVQWTACIQSALDCAREGGDLPDCVDGATCPQACRDRYAETLAGRTDRETRFDVFHAEFIADDAFCRPPEEAWR